MDEWEALKKKNANECEKESECSFGKSFATGKGNECNEESKELNERECVSDKPFGAKEGNECNKESENLNKFTHNAENVLQLFLSDLVDTCCLKKVRH